MATVHLLGGPFAAIAAERLGPMPDLTSFRADEHPPDVLAEARRVWPNRVVTEYRSVQIMTRFLEELAGSGEALDVIASAIDFVEDEVRHVALAAAACRALGVEPTLPAPTRLVDPEPYLRAPMHHRALTTAISMLAINETMSVGFIEDLRDGCGDRAIRSILDATIADEEAHEGIGWEYVRIALARFPPSTLDDWRHLVRTTLAPHERNIDAALAGVPDRDRHLEAHVDEARARLGLHGRVRQALVARHTLEAKVKPRLRALDLLA